MLSTFLLHLFPIIFCTDFPPILILRPYFPALQLRPVRKKSPGNAETLYYSVPGRIRAAGLSLKGYPNVSDTLTGNFPSRSSQNS